MAITADECRRMIRTCQTNRVKLMIAYRLHVRPAVVRALGLVRAGHVGIPKTFSADFTTRIEDPENTRLQRRLGGGTVYHLGVECIHAARSVLGAEPAQRSEEHTSELQSHSDLVCRLLLEKRKHKPM